MKGSTLGLTKGLRLELGQCLEMRERRTLICRIWIWLSTLLEKIVSRLR
jgi:hypothetical protein